MAGETLGFWDYVKAAFWYKPRVGFLGPLPLNVMALFTCVVASLATQNAGFLFLGGAAEIGYLAFLSSNPSFQKLVQGLRLLARQEGWQQKVQASLARLRPDSMERYRRLYEQCRLILGVSDRVAPDDMFSIRDMRAGGLNQLLWLFLRLLTSRELIVASLSSANRAELEAEVKRLEERLARAEPESALARSLQGTLDIQSKRLDNLTRALSSLEVIDAELERIEQQVQLIREEVAVATGPDALSSRLDAVTATLGETSRWMDQHAEFFGSISGDDEVLGAPVLPSLPEPPATPKPPPPPRQKQRQ
ncbi:MAG TPA: hypothetical protein P5234_14690 [Thermoanaerobaculaceae bacterium]|nr:hypothetical protein [Thermoanaerobaculaceae bacterium]HRS17480.1 hypothetical protein [Thermoanaerobaculaceae bacterium]